MCRIDSRSATSAGHSTRCMSARSRSSDMGNSVSLHSNRSRSNRHNRSKERVSLLLLPLPAPPLPLPLHQQTTCARVGVAHESVRACIVGSDVATSTQQPTWFRKKCASPFETRETALEEERASSRTTECNSSNNPQPQLHLSQPLLLLPFPPSSLLRCRWWQWLQHPVWLQQLRWLALLLLHQETRAALPRGQRLAARRRTTTGMQTQGTVAAAARPPLLLLVQHLQQLLQLRRGQQGASANKHQRKEHRHGLIRQRRMGWRLRAPAVRQ